MLSRELLSEYNRNITRQRMGDRILAAFSETPTWAIPDTLYNLHTMQKAAENPEDYFQKDKGIIISTPLTGSITVNKSNVGELYEKLKPGIIDLILKRFEDADPSPNKEYVGWMLRTYLKNHKQGFETLYDEYLKAHYEGKQRNLLRPEHRDIGKFKSMATLVNIINLTYNIHQLLGQSEYDIIYDGDDATVIIPRNVEAACEFGTENWCTVKKSTFKSYTETGPLYIIRPKSPQYRGEMYQVHAVTGEFKNEENDNVDEYDLLIRKFPGAGQAIVEREPKLQQWIAFSNINDIETLWRAVIETIKQQAYTIISEEEFEDDDYRQTLEQNGCIDEAGEYDWDRIERLGLTYIQYDTTSALTIRSLDQMQRLSGSQIRQQIIDYGNEERTEPTMSDMNMIAAEELTREYANEQSRILLNLAEFAELRVRIVLNEVLDDQIESMKKEDANLRIFTNMGQSVRIDSKVNYTTVGNFTIVVQR